jgi:hypothetical protein
MRDIESFAANKYIEKLIQSESTKVKMTVGSWEKKTSELKKRTMKSDQRQLVIKSETPKDRTFAQIRKLGH